MKTSFAVFLGLVTAGVASSNENGLIGEWEYISIEFLDHLGEIHEGDGNRFTDKMVFWRWLSQDHENRYQLAKHKGHLAFIGFEEEGNESIKAIYRIEGDRLTICDRRSDLGFPDKFSKEDGTLIQLRKKASPPEAQQDGDDKQSPP